VASRNIVNILTDFPDEIEESIIRQICAQREQSTGLEISAAYVSRFQRFGKSGARLLLLFFSSKPEGLPFLVKICQNEGKKLDAKKELDAVLSMANLVGDCDLPEKDLFEHKGWGGILYAHRGAVQPGEAAKNPVTFRQIMYYPHSSKESMPSGFPRSFSKKVLEKCLTEVFEKLQEAHSRLTPKNVDVPRHYGNYLGGNAATKRIARILGSAHSKESLRFAGKKIMNPILLRQKLPQRRDIQQGRIHGDLHPDNIVLSRALTPCLIDFAWAKRHRDVFIDFVLLESSIRFWHFPHSANLSEQALVDELLLHEDGAAHVVDREFSDRLTTNLYHRLATMVGVIRSRAKQALSGRFSMEEYLLTQFIVLYGLMEYESYVPSITTRALGLIGKRLCDTGAM